MNNVIYSVKANDGDNNITNNNNLFLEICNTLTNDGLSDGLINHEKLHSMLVSSGKFTASEATQAIKEALESGCLIEVGWHLYTAAVKKIE
jgi:hypothetical protein